MDQIIGQASDSGDLYEINIPARLKRCGIETKLIISESTPQDVHDKTRQALQSALAKALDWNQQLISGDASSMATLAKREGVTQRYISHLLKLAYLAPDIMTAIVKGQIPYDLTLTRKMPDVCLFCSVEATFFGYRDAFPNCPGNGTHRMVSAIGSDPTCPNHHHTCPWCSS